MVESWLTFLYPFEKLSKKNINNSLYIDKSGGFEKEKNEICLPNTNQTTKGILGSIKKAMAVVASFIDHLCHESLFAKS
ncbi:MAG: hypothetical protein KDD34_03820 [Bdellovibrionales bacterium]|nr:hypothetical protein [Bdellovibrionales bacterium]